MHRLGIAGGIHAHEPVRLGRGKLRVGVGNGALELLALALEAIVLGTTLGRRRQVEPQQHRQVGHQVAHGGRVDAAHRSGPRSRATPW